MGFPQGMATEASSASYTGSDCPLDSTGEGSVQCGTFASGYVAITDAVPAQTNIYITGTNVVRIGAPNQLALRVSLTAGTVQLTGNVSTAQNRTTNPPTGVIRWVSTNSHIATVSPSGLVTLLRKGQVTIEARYSRQANVSFAGSTPSQTESMAAYATIDITIGV